MGPPCQTRLTLSIRAKTSLVALFVHQCVTTGEDGRLGPEWREIPRLGIELQQKGDSLVGRTLAHYRIEERLGKGGMGVVYRAFDTRLKRDVAIKVLSRSEQGPDELARLLAEARAAAPLNHPAIATIHEVGECDDLSFIVMEFVTGRTLRDAYAEQGCGDERLARIGIEIARGLQAAHERGVVHGDVKLDNLMVGPDDRIKILDFGVARRTSVGPSDATLSLGEMWWNEPGKISGTLAYMAPEQLRGETIDGRADLYSLGVVLYELATHKRPYAGETSAELIAQVLSQDPPPLHELERSQPPELVRIVGRLLAKNVRDRYPSAREVAVELENYLGSPKAVRASVGESRRSVAVLPFPLLAGSAEDEFLSVALAEAVAHGLSQNAALAVRPASAVMRYATRSVDPLRAARELNVQVIVEGSIQRLGSAVRVQVQAWKAAEGSTMLSVKLDGNMTELFDLQDRLADALANGLGVEPSAPTAAEPPTRNARAYEQYLRASERLLRYSQRGTRDAIEMLRSAVGLDSRFAEAWARLAAATVAMAALFDSDERWYLEAEQAVVRALELDPTNPEAWIARGRMVWSPHHGFRHAEAWRDFARTRHLTPRPHDGPLWEGIVLLHVGLYPEARSCLAEALEEQPDDLMAMLALGEIASFEGDYLGALEHFGRTLALEPSHVWCNMFTPVGHIYLNELDRAEQAVHSARRFVGDDSLLRASEALVWAKRGEADVAGEHARRAVEHLRSLSHEHHTRHYVAAALATIGQPAEALDQLRHAAEAGLPNYPLFLSDPHFDSLRARSDFEQFVRGLKPGWEALRNEFGRGS